MLQSVSCETAGVGRRRREQRYKARKEIYKEIYTGKERKIRLKSRVIWNRKTHTDYEIKRRQRKRKCKARKKEK